MRRSLRLAASPLLQHIHHSLPALQRLYDASHPAPPLAATAEGALHTPLTAAQRASAGAPRGFPADPQTPAEGDAVVRFFCAELGMGDAPVMQWRARLRQRMHQRWGLADSRGGPVAEGPMPWTAVRGAGDAVQQQQQQTRWLRPRPQDVAVVRSAIQHLRFVVSPLLLLSPPPVCTAPAQRGEVPQGTTAPSQLRETPCQQQPAPPPPEVSGSAALRPTSYADCSRWYATHSIPAGMFLLSIPTDAVVFANPPPASDPLLQYFMTVEELVAQLVDAATSPDAPHHGYARYLCESVVPCRNLPFLSLGEVRRRFFDDAHKEAASAAACDDGSSSSSSSSSGGVEAEAPLPDSPALSLLSFFHDDMRGEPLSDYLRSRLTREEYAWWVSLVLSHRSGSSSLLPMIDKLNHSPLPNCYYTMATSDTVCGLDVLDNMLAGVPGELLYQPYVHVFAMRDIAAGEELTLCYASAADSAYRPADRRVPPPRPASLPSPPDRREATRDAGDNAAAQHPGSDPASMTEVMDALFPQAGALPADADESALQRLQHAGQQEVATAEGGAAWQLQWGFVPPCDAVYSARDLMEVAAIVAERRLDTRTAVFPPAASRSAAAAASPPAPA